MTSNVLRKSATNIFKLFPPRLKTVTTLPCEIRRSCQSNCLKQPPCVQTQAWNLLPLINCFIYNTQPTSSSPSAAALTSYMGM